VSPEFRRKWSFPPKAGLFKFVRTTPNGVRRRFRLNTKPARSCTELHEVRRKWPKIRGKITEFGRFRSSSCTKTHEKPPPLNPKFNEYRRNGPAKVRLRLNDEIGTKLCGFDQNTNLSGWQKHENFNEN
jgi:hypothetical protein